MALEGDTGAVLLLRNLVTPHLGLRPSPRSYLSSVSKSHDASREDKAAIVPCTFTREKLPVQVATRNPHPGKEGTPRRPADYSLPRGQLLEFTGRPSGLL